MSNRIKTLRRAAATPTWSKSPSKVQPSGDPDLLRAVLDICPDPVLLLDPQAACWIDCNAAAEELLECESGSIAKLPAELLITGLAMDFVADGPVCGELRTASGNLLPVELEVRETIGSAGPVWLVVARSRLAARPAHATASSDYLTGLANRRTFDSRLQRAIERAAEHADYQFAVLFIDLDNFKQVNDVHGHLVGDQLLVSVAERFLAAVRPHDMVARRDGDEFTILLDYLAQPADAVHVAERIEQRLAEPHEFDRRTLTVTASIGIALAERGEKLLDLVRRADAAMYRAKAAGLGHCVCPNAQPGNPPPTTELRST